MATSRKTALAISIAAVPILALPFAPRAAALVYWANNGGTTIGRAALDGTGVNQSFIRGANGPCGVAVNALGVGYPRPKGASPLQVPLVPAFNPCDAPNRTHGAPLSFGSCAAPVQARSGSRRSSAIPRRRRTRLT